MQVGHREPIHSKSHQSLAKTPSYTNLALFCRRSYHCLEKLSFSRILCRRFSMICLSVPKTKHYSMLSSPSKFKILWQMRFWYNLVLRLLTRIHQALKVNSQETAFSYSTGRVRFSLTMCSKELTLSRTLRSKTRFHPYRQAFTAKMSSLTCKLTLSSPTSSEKRTSNSPLQCSTLKQTSRQKLVSWSTHS